METQFTLIAAIDANGAIGYMGDQLAYISDDLRHFKAATMDKPIIMGRKTNEALPKRRLPGRRNVVLTRDSSFDVEGVEVVGSVKAALALLRGVPEAMVIGGAQVYEAFMPFASKLIITHIDHAFEKADTYFPSLKGWEPEEESEKMYDEKTGLAYRYVTYVRE